MHKTAQQPRGLSTGCSATVLTCSGGLYTQSRTGTMVKPMSNSKLSTIRPIRGSAYRSSPTPRVLVLHPPLVYPSLRDPCGTAHLPHTLHIQGIYTPPPPPYPRPCARHNKTPGDSECTVINLPFGGPLPRASSCVTKPGCGPTYTHLTVNIWYSPIDSRQNYNTVHHWIDARFRIIFHK